MNRGERQPPRAYVAGPPSRPRAAGAPSGSEQRSRLEALFGGGHAGGGPRHATASRLSQGPHRTIRRTPSEYRMRLERLRLACEPEDIREATDQYLKIHQLPDDVEILVKVLQHPSEEVLRDALGQITSLYYQGRLHHSALLRERLDAIAARPNLPDPIRSLLSGLQEVLTKQAGAQAVAPAGPADAAACVADAAAAGTTCDSTPPADDLA